ncbi:hypothetical protein MKX29_24075 [Cytobacillus sp. FSL R7-0696]|uniref:hypothetical protein n=1 Tax=Cytobacillus sp. FSL R7-0696 TaxID=2921691 RepID=UPI0030F94680
MRLFIILFIAIMAGGATHDYIYGYYGFATFELVLAIGLIYELMINRRTNK